MVYQTQILNHSRNFSYWSKGVIPKVVVKGLQELGEVTRQGAISQP